MVEEMYLDAEKPTQRQREAYAKEHGFERVVAAFVLYSVLANEKGITQINGTLDEVYAINYQQIARALGITGGKNVDISKLLTRFDKRAYNRLVSESKLSRDIAKEVTRMVKQGWSVPKMEKQIRTLFRKSKTSALLTARTEMTRIENRGRQSAFEDAAKKGVKAKKQWVATADSRVRDTHAAIDGEIVELHETFSNGLEFPGDASGEPAEVCNCRCTMIPVQD